MTTSPNEFIATGEEASTDELLRDRMSAHLGQEAADRFFAQLRGEASLVRRAQYLARAAEFLEVYGEEDVKIASKIEVVTSEILTGHDEEIAIVETSVIRDIATDEVQQSVVQSGDPEDQSKVLKLHPDHETKDTFEVDKRIGILLDDLCGTELFELTIDDKDAVVRGLMEVRGKLGPRGIPSTFIQMLEGMYDGKAQAAIARDLGISDQAMSQKWIGFRKRCLENFQERASEALEVIRRHARPDMIDMLPEARESTLPVPSAEDVANIHAGSPREESKAIDTVVAEIERDTIDHQSNVQFDEVFEQLVSDNVILRDSIEALLIGDRFDEESMGLGKSLLSDLMSKYAPNRGDARTHIGYVNDAAYKILCSLAGTDTRGSNSLSRTLPTLMKFERSTNEEEVMDHLARLIDAALRESYAIEPPKPKPSPVAMPLTLVRDQSVAEKEVEAKRELAQPIDLFAVAKGDVEIGTHDWNLEVERLFESLVSRKVLSGYKAELLKNRALGEDDSRDVDDQTRAVLDMLQQKSREPGSRINEDEGVRAAFNIFVITALGVNNLDDVLQRLNRNSKREIKLHTVQRRVIGGIAAVLGDSTNE